MYPGDEIARQAFEIMVRDGLWAYPACIIDRSAWLVGGLPNVQREQKTYADPFTAIVEAKRSAKVEEQCSTET